MKGITLGLALSLFGSIALGDAVMAQTSPPPSPPAPKPPAGGPTQPPSTSGQNAQGLIPAPSGPPEGMVVETPNGFYLVRPGDPNPQRLDLGRNGGSGRSDMDRPMPEQNGPAAMAEGDDMRGDMGGDRAEGGMQPPPRRRGPPPRPAEGKGARLHIHAPNLDVNVKCPDDESVKACVDAVSQLMDKANVSPH